jgi:hypothetical protein
MVFFESLLDTTFQEDPPYWDTTTPGKFDDDPDFSMPLWKVGLEVLAEVHPNQITRLH